MSGSLNSFFFIELGEETAAEIEPKTFDTVEVHLMGVPKETNRTLIDNNFFLVQLL